MYLTLPETRGRTVEELEELFQSKNPVKASLSSKVVLVKQGEGIKVVEEDD